MAKESSQEPDPQQGDSFAARLKKKYGAGVDPQVSLGGEENADSGAGSSRLLDRLAEQGVKSARYRLEGEVARGGMGAILKIWDEDLRRQLAMKVIATKGEPPAESAGTPPTSSKQVARF